MERTVDLVAAVADPRVTRGVWGLLPQEQFLEPRCHQELAQPLVAGLLRATAPREC